jgi:hypothetical protein
VIVTAVAFDEATVKTEELPETIDVGLAVMVTVGGGLGVTVRVAVAVTFPPAPVAVAVYVVVAAGVTACTPPVGDKV